MMVDKQLVRESVAKVVDSGNHYEYTYIYEDILHSKAFMQLMYKRSYKLFIQMRYYLKDHEIHNQVIEEQEKIELGNAFMNFCKNATIIKHNLKIDLDNMTRTESEVFKAFYPMYQKQKILVDELRKIQDNTTYSIMATVDPDVTINWGACMSRKDSRNFSIELEQIAQRALEKVSEIHY